MNIPPKSSLLLIVCFLSLTIGYFSNQKSVSATIPSQTIHAPQGNDAWTAQTARHDINNQQGPTISVIAIDTNNPSIIYAGSNQGFYRSITSGDGWERRSDGLGGTGDLVITSIAIDPTNSSRILIGTWGAGVWQSLNSGTTWQKLTDPLSATNLSMRAFNQTILPDNVPAVNGFGTAPEFVPGTEQSRYTQVEPQQWRRTAIRHVAINPTNPQEIFVSIDDGFGLYHSTDGGTTWTQQDQFPITENVSSSRAFTFAPSNSQIRYTSFGTWGESGGLFRTTNGGAVWSQVGSGTINGTVIDIDIHPTDPNIVLIATSGDGLYRSNNGGNSWVAVNMGLEDAWFYSISFAPSNPNIAYVGGYDQLYKSEDQGQTWQKISDTLSANYWQGLAVHPTQPNTVFGGSNVQGGVYRTIDGGNSFLFRSIGMDDLIVLDIEQDPNNPQRLFAATWGAGLYRSTNNGSTWQKVTDVFSPYIYDIKAIDNGGQTTIYATTFYSDYGIFKSTNGGNSWSQISNTYPSNISFGIETLNNNPNHVVAATYRGVQYSYDGGTTWQEASGGLNISEGQVLKICNFPSSSRLLAATFGGGLFYTTGQYWYQTNTGLTGANFGFVYDVACSPNIPGLAYAAGLGVYKTTDYGETWTYMSGLPANTYFRSIKIIPETGDVVVASNDKGVYFSPKGLSLWTKLATGLGSRDEQMRSLAITSSSPVRMLAGTNGSGIWEYTMITPLNGTQSYLPLISNNYAPPAVNIVCRTHEPNNTLSTATFVGSPNTYCSDFEDEEDTEDWYRINITALGNLTVTLSNMAPGNDFDLELYSTNGNLLVGSYLGGNNVDQIVFRPASTGVHYIRVIPFSRGGLNWYYYLTLEYNKQPVNTGVWQGQLYYNGESIASIPFKLSHYNGYRTVFFETTATNNDGQFSFSNLKGLPLGHTYFPHYSNSMGNEQYLNSWACWSMAGNLETILSATCEADIANVPLQSPAAQSHVQFPVTFTWNSRQIPGDTYRLQISNSNNYWRSEVLSGDLEEYTFNSLPSGLSYDTPLVWQIVIFTELGYGYSYEARRVQFSAGLHDAEDSPLVLPPLRQDWLQPQK